MENDDCYICELKAQLKQARDEVKKVVDLERKFKILKSDVLGDPMTLQARFVKVRQQYWDYQQLCEAYKAVIDEILNALTDNGLDATRKEVEKALNEKIKKGTATK